MDASTETPAEAIEYARGILGRADTLAEIIGRYDRLLAEDEPGLFSWHQALCEVARQARRAAEDLAVSVAKGDVIRVVPERGPERLMLVAHVEQHIITLSDLHGEEEPADA